MPGSHRNGFAILEAGFFDRDPQVVACDLIGKVLLHRVHGRLHSARIIETEAYYLWDRASHASLGHTPKRDALFASPGTIYMYYARGGDSFNISCRGRGNAVLIKAAVPQALPGEDHAAMLAGMHRLNPLPSGALRPDNRLCSGQTLLCRSLGLKVKEWDGQPLGDAATPEAPRIINTGSVPRMLLRAPRLGIPRGRDHDLPFRFLDALQAHLATRNPAAGKAKPGRDYALLPAPLPGPSGAPDWAGLLHG
ncbi:MAG: DNA-3-methyladenine glycosylase [Deltaproteobacteria bacterium]|nr:DNA-3-methyladenine glycosylase [Deltaproteobacteria bacterium]